MTKETKYEKKKKKVKQTFPEGVTWGFFGGEGVKMSRWDTGTRLPILDKIKRNRKPPSLRTADAFLVVASLASADEATQKQKLAIFASLIWEGVRGGGGGGGYKFSILI